MPRKLLNQPFNIGLLRLKNRVLQAPMAGISGRAWRLQSLRYGAGLAFTEMISSYGIHYGNRHTIEMLKLTAGEHPVAVQLFGNQPQIIAEAAIAAEKSGADIIDINMGCPARKVIKTGAGVALMRDERLAVEILSATAKAVSVPVTAKIRSGFSRVTAYSLARRLQEAGAAAISIHPRTCKQQWRGTADHSITARLAAELDIPVIASGGISRINDAEVLLNEAGAAAVMIGRAALGNPWIFNDFLNGEEPCARPVDEVINEMQLFYRNTVSEMGRQRAVPYMRKFYGWYLSPLGASSALKLRLRQAESFDQAVEAARRGLLCSF